MTVNNKALDTAGYTDQTLVEKWANPSVATDANEAFAILYARYDRAIAIDTKDPHWANRPLHYRFQIFFNYCRRLKSAFDTADRLSLETWVTTDARLHRTPKPKYFESEKFKSKGLLPWLITVAQYKHLEDCRKAISKPDPENPDAPRRARYISWEVTINGETFGLEIEAVNSNFQLAPIMTTIAGKEYPLSLPVNENALSLARAICLQSAILQLETRDRDVFVLFNLEQMSIKEVAEKLELPADKVPLINLKAKKKLRQLLPEDFLD
jgi:RNA polymerase sigma factor (sigma-70 family)